ncbi:MAG: LuxR C-terminal-related transcriptional regulator [Acidimicrobiales bacterium]
MVERGVNGVLDVRSSWPVLRAVQAVATGETWLPRQIESDLLRSMLLTRAMDDLVIGCLLRLTQREREVLLLLCRGQNRSEVSEALHISSHTARTHVQRVIEKFGVHSQREVLALGLKHRLADRFDGC